MRMFWTSAGGGLCVVSGLYTIHMPMGPVGRCRLVWKTDQTDINGLPVYRQIGAGGLPALKVRAENHAARQEAKKNNNRA